MSRYFNTFGLFLLLLCCDNVSLLNNGLAQKPPLGWMSWGYYECAVDCDNNPDKCLNEKLIMSVADEFYNNGYLEAGYEYIVIDDCWSEKKRDKNGSLVADRKRFPRGMKFLADYIHNKSLKFGMYTNVAKVTCKNYPASLGHFDIDSKTFASWEIDYLKVDGCFVGEDVLDSAYVKLGQYLNETGRPIVYSCSWPYYIQFIFNHTPNYEAIAKTCNVFRNYHDIFPFWGNVIGILQFYEQEYEVLQKYHRPGQWFDPDMLVFFNMVSAPLMLSCDLRNVPVAHRDLILDPELMAIGQDPRGIFPKPYKFSSKVTLWVKPRLPMTGDKFPTYSFAFINIGNEPAQITFRIQDYGLNYTYGYQMHDTLAKVTIKYSTQLGDPLTTMVPPKDSVLYSFYPTH